MNATLGVTTLGLYLTAIILLWFDNLWTGKEENESAERSPDSSARNSSSSSNSIVHPTIKPTTLGFVATVLGGLAVHFILAAQTSYVQHSFNFSVASMSLWISALVIFIFLVGTLIHPIKNLGLVVLPVSSLCLLFAFFWGDNVTLVSQQTSLFYWHIALSITGFTLLALSVLQSILFAVQEISFRRHKSNHLTKLLPPLQTMEQVLFKILWLGFSTLTIAIILGAFYNYQTKGNFFSFTHHNLLSFLGWLAFAILLYGRIIYGWRGIQAVKWTIGGFALIELGYFGSKIISEMVA